MLDSVASKPELAELLTLTKTEQILRLAQINVELEQLSAQERVKWALENLDGEFAVSSSFGIQAAVMLHLVTQEKTLISQLFLRIPDICLQKHIALLMS